MNLEKTQMLTVATTHLTHDTLENFAKICANSGKLVCYPMAILFIYWVNRLT